MNWLVGVLAIAGLLQSAWPVWAGGTQDFKLLDAIPADAMIVVHCRDHAGRAFVNEQFKRVWAAIEKQRFESDIRFLLRSMVEEQEGDVEEFDQQWRRIADLAAGVTWSRLIEREFAFAMKIGMPAGFEFVMLMKPPEDEVARDFEGLTAILKGLTELAPESGLTVTTQTEEDAVWHRLSLPIPMPLGLTLARYKDTLVVSFGAGMFEQTLALLRGKTEGGPATLASTDRFKQAFKQLPPPTDSLYFVDLARIMAQCRVFAQMAAQAINIGMAGEKQAADSESGQPPTTGPARLAKMGDFLPKIVDELDLWDYVAGVASTDGMKTLSQTVVVLRDEAKARPMFKVLYGNRPLREPLKYVPRQATWVSVSSGFDLQTLYRTVLDFLAREVPAAAEGLENWKRAQAEMDFDLDQDLLAWLGGGYTVFTISRASSYLSEWVLLLTVRDDQKARQTLEDLSTRLDEYLVRQNGAIEDANLEGAEGFKRVILPPLFAMIPGLGRPVFGVKDGHLFIANSPEAVAAALKAASDREENFTASERFRQEGLPLGENVTGFSFSDLSRWGEELGQALGMVGMISMFDPDAAKKPSTATILRLVNKVSRVARTLDFYRSTCSVSTFDGKVSVTKTVTNYQEPPKPKAPEPTEEKPTTQPTT